MIVFNVGGTIELKQTLTFKERKNITVAGQTAPGMVLPCPAGIQISAILKI